MKEFNNFRLFLDENGMSDIVIQNFYESLDTYKDQQIDNVTLSKILVISNYKTMLDLLEKYHDWLNLK